MRAEHRVRQRTVPAGTGRTPDWTGCTDGLIPGAGRSRRSSKAGAKAALRSALTGAVLVLGAGPLVAGVSFGDAALVAAAGADIYSTQAAVRRGGLELNPLMAGPLPAQVAIKAGVSAVAIGQCHHWEREGHRNRARVLRWGLVGLWGGVAAWNFTRGGR